MQFAGPLNTTALKTTKNSKCFICKYKYNKDIKRFIDALIRQKCTLK